VRRERRTRARSDNRGVLDGEAERGCRTRQLCLSGRRRGVSDRQTDMARRRVDMLGQIPLVREPNCLRDDEGTAQHDKTVVP